MFNNIYKDAEAHEKVKYGALNIFDEHHGIYACRSYGDSFFILKDEIKNRASFVLGDSSIMMMHICTFKYFKQLLIHPTEKHFKSIVNHILSKNNNCVNYPYIEAQIHGPVRMDCDIEKYCIKESIFEKLSHIDQSKINDFCMKNKIKFVILK